MKTKIEEKKTLFLHLIYAIVEKRASKETIDTVNKIIAMYDHELQYQPSWIPVEKELPEKGERVITMSENGIQIAWLNNSNKWQFLIGEYSPTITHWQPLPSSESRLKTP